MYDGSYKWLRRFFLPDIEMMFSLSSIQSMSLHWSIEWELTKKQSRVFLRRISHHTAITAGHGRNVVGLLLGSLKAEYPIGETSHQAAMFIDEFMAVKDEFPKDELRALGWVHSSDKYWWSRMVGFVLEDMKKELIQTSFYAAVRAIQYGIRRVIITSSLYWSGIIRRRAHSSSQFERWGLLYTRCMKSPG